MFRKIFVITVLVFVVSVFFAIPTSANDLKGLIYINGQK